MKNIAVILSGGSGLRTGLAEPKQFADLGGKMVVEHALAMFCAHPAVDEVCMVCHKDYIPRMERLAATGRYPKWTRILPGGITRKDSSLAAIGAYTDPDDNLIFHDAARPLVSSRILDDITAALRTYRAVNVCVPSSDTLMRTDTSGRFIEEIPPRRLWLRSQTPQAFRRHVIAEAYHRAEADIHFEPTDDCAVVKKYMPEEPIFVVQGEAANMKLTYPEDFYYIRFWMS